MDLSIITYLVSIIKKYNKFFIIFNSIVLFSSIIILLLLPKWYVGRAQLIIKNPTQMPGLSLLQNLSPSGLLGLEGTSVDFYFTLIESRRLLDKVIEKFKLDTIYDYKFKEDLYNQIRKDIRLSESKEGSLILECYYKNDPYLAADLANFTFEELKKLVIEISNNQAREYRQFLEKIYQETLRELEAKEDSLKNFQEISNIYIVEEQLKNIVDLISELKLQKMQLEIEKKFYESIQNEKSQKVKELKEKIKIIDTEYNKIIQTNEYSLVPLKNMPEAALQYYRLYRDIKLKQQILEFLVPQLEQAKLEEKKNTAEIYLLDKAVPLLKKAKPKRAKLLIIIMLLNGIISIVIIKIYEIYKNFSLSSQMTT